MRRKAIFLDRDGVLNLAIVRNGKPYPPANLNELSIPADAYTALTLLKSAGFVLIGATNQPDVARGKTPQSQVEAINQALMAQLPLDAMRVCYHDDADACACRKPLPGLLTQAAIDYHIDLSQSFMIGDRWKDISAGQLAGCKTIWLKQNYDEPEPPTPADFITHSLHDAATWILENNLIKTTEHADSA